MLGRIVGRYGFEHESTMRMFMVIAEGPEESAKGNMQWCTSSSNRPTFSIQL
jgi:hypothetical protein